MPIRLYGSKNAKTCDLRMKASSGRWISSRLSHISGTRSARTGSIIAVAGVACAVAVMLLTIGIALGFKHDIKAKLSGFESQIGITPAYSYMTGRTDSTITLDAALRRTIDSIMPQATVTLAYRQPAILKPSDDFSAVIIYGYDDVHDTAFEQKTSSKASCHYMQRTERQTTWWLYRPIPHQDCILMSETGLRYASL